MSIIPMPSGAAAAADSVQTGTVDVTVATSSSLVGYRSSGLGSLANDTLITVNGTLGVINTMFTNTTGGSSNAVSIDFGTSALAQIALDYVQVAYTNLSSASWSVPTASMSVSSTSVSASELTNPNAWGPGDVGNTETVSWS